MGHWRNRPTAGVGRARAGLSLCSTRRRRAHERKSDNPALRRRWRQVALCHGSNHPDGGPLTIQLVADHDPSNQGAAALLLVEARLRGSRARRRVISFAFCAVRKRPSDCWPRWLTRSSQSPSSQQRTATPTHCRSSRKGPVTRQRRSSSETRPVGELTVRLLTQPEEQPARHFALTKAVETLRLCDQSEGPTGYQSQVGSVGPTAGTPSS